MLKNIKYLALKLYIFQLAYFNYIYGEVKA